MTDRDVTVTERLSEQGLTDGRSPSKCEQICQTLRRYIGSGQLGAGQQLPAERALSERFATTRITCKQTTSVVNRSNTSACWTLRKGFHFANHFHQKQQLPI